MGFFHAAVQYLKEYLLFNPLFWGIAAVVIWIVASAFLKAWRKKDGDENGEV